MRSLFIGFVCLVALAVPSLAQLGHYWTHQYGVRSTLLGNSVIGSVEDLGSVYYNPARIALIEDLAFLISADVYEWTTLRFDDAVGEGSDLKQSGFGNAPGFAAGTFKIKFLPKHKFAYAIFGRENTNTTLSYRNQIERDVFPEVSGNETLGAGISFTLNSRTRWYALSWAYPLSDKLGVGVTMVGAQTSQKRSGEIQLQALNVPGDVATYLFDRAYNFNHDGILWKIGLAGQVFEKVDWGVTLTTPVIGIRGKGNYNYEEYLSNFEGLPEPDRFTSDWQSDLDITLRTPLSVGLGFSIPLSRFRIHLSSEWYNRIGHYTIMQSTEHVSQSSGDTLGIQVVDQLGHVVNVGIGFDYALLEDVQLYASFNSDFSAVAGDVVSFVRNETIVTNSTWTADFWHYAAGASFKVKTAEITLGFSRTSARQDYARPLDFPDDEGEVGFETEDPSTLRWSRLKIIFGFSIELGKSKGSE